MMNIIVVVTCDLGAFAAVVARGQMSSQTTKYEETIGDEK